MATQDRMLQGPPAWPPALSRQASGPAVAWLVQLGGVMFQRWLMGTDSES